MRPGYLNGSSVIRICMAPFYYRTLTDEVKAKEARVERLEELGTGREARGKGKGVAAIERYRCEEEGYSRRTRRTKGTRLMDYAAA